MSLASVLQRLLGLAGIGVCLAAAPALGTDLPPGVTLDPVPVVAIPSGAVLENTYSRDFDISWTTGFPPLPRHMTGTVTQNVYRLGDNTLLFRYYVSNDSSSMGAVTRVAASNFGDFSTD